MLRRRSSSVSRFWRTRSNTQPATTSDGTRSVPRKRALNNPKAKIQIIINYLNICMYHVFVSYVCLTIIEFKNKLTDYIINVFFFLFVWTSAACTYVSPATC